MGEGDVEADASIASEMEERSEKSGSLSLRAVSPWPVDVPLPSIDELDVELRAGYGYFLLGLIGKVAYVLEVVGIYLDAGS